MSGQKREARLRLGVPGIHICQASRNKEVDGRDNNVL